MKKERLLAGGTLLGVIALTLVGFFFGGCSDEVAALREQLAKAQEAKEAAEKIAVEAAATLASMKDELGENVQELRSRLDEALNAKKDLEASAAEYGETVANLRLENSRLQEHQDSLTTEVQQLTRDRKRLKRASEERLRKFFDMFE